MTTRTRGRSRHTGQAMTAAIPNPSPLRQLVPVAQEQEVIPMRNYEWH